MRPHAAPISSYVTLRTAGHVPQDYLWQQINARDRFIEVCDSWLRTPYQAHQRIKGVGADCKELVCGVLDELFRRESPTTVPRRSPNVATHWPKRALPVVSAIRRSYDSELIRSGTIEVGDVLVTRACFSTASPENGGHVMLAWVTPGTVLDIVNFGHARISSIQVNKGILGIYRPKGKEAWA